MICGCEKELGEIGINLNSLMRQSGDGNGWVWALESNNLFSVSSLRKLIDAILLPEADTETEWIAWIPSKANILLWRILRNRMATKDNLLNRGIAISSNACPLCLSCPENLDHVMNNCNTTKIVAALLTNIGWTGGQTETRTPIIYGYRFARLRETR